MMERFMSLLCWTPEGKTIEFHTFRCLTLKFSPISSFQASDSKPSVEAVVEAFKHESTADHKHI